MNLNPLQQAFKDWQDAFPGDIKGEREHVCWTVEELKGKKFPIPRNWNGDCSCPGGSSYHYIYVRDNASARYVGYDRPDNEVCHRERLWRKYCRLRDNY